jgi:putative transposase
MTKRAKTQSFILELPLLASPTDESSVLSRLEAARQIMNGCLGESLRRLALMRQSKAFQTARAMPNGKERIEALKIARAMPKGKERIEALKSARAMPDGKERADAFDKVNEKYGFREFDLYSYSKQFGYSWLGDHIDSVTVQALTNRSFRSAQRYAFGKAGRPRFKKYGQVDSVESKDNRAGIRWREGHVEWSGLSLKAIIDLDDEVIIHGLKQRVKYVRLVRRKLNEKNRFFVQLVCEGKPFRKEKHKIGTAIVGLDQGPSILAIVAPKAGFADKKLICKELDDRQAEIRRLQRHLDRQRRANNPDNYNLNGTVKKGPKEWKTSARMITTRAQLAEIHRLQAAYRYSLQGNIVNNILKIGNRIRTEKVSKKWWQKKFGKSVRHRAPGMLETRLLRKAESAGGKSDLIPTRSTRLSQVCHCGSEVPKDIGTREHICPNCGIVCDRDLYSAFLASCVEGGKLDAGRAERLWPGVDALLRAASSKWQESASGRRKSSHGKKFFRQSRSPVAARMNVGEAHDVVVPLKGRERARADGTPGTLRL